MAKKHTEPKAKSEWIDPDDAPELTEEWFRRADQYDGEVLIRRGDRPPDDEPKKPRPLPSKK